MTFWFEIIQIEISKLGCSSESELPSSRLNSTLFNWRYLMTCVMNGTHTGPPNLSNKKKNLTRIRILVRNWPRHYDKLFTETLSGEFYPVSRPCPLHAGQQKSVESYIRYISSVSHIHTCTQLQWQRWYVTSEGQCISIRIAIHRGENENRRESYPRAKLAAETSFDCKLQNFTPKQSKGVLPLRRACRGDFR